MRKRKTRHVINHDDQTYNSAGILRAATNQRRKGVRGTGLHLLGSAYQLPKEYMDKYREMTEWADAHDDLPDGAFFAMAEEVMGWTVDDWVWYADEQAKRK